MFKKHYQIDNNHIDFQGVVDGLYFPFYFEWCRHAFMKEVVGLDLEEEAKQGNMYVLAEYTLRFKKPLHANETVTVTCQLVPGSKESRFNFRQTLSVDDVIRAEAEFVGTCVPQGGRPFVPDIVKKHITHSSG
jgi:acyl-CoA thioester hydrolase